MVEFKNKACGTNSCANLLELVLCVKKKHGIESAGIS